MEVRGSAVLALDPHLCAVEGIGSAKAQALVGGGEYPQTMVVGVSKTVHGDGLEVHAVLRNIQVKALLCLAHVVEQPDGTGDVADRDVFKHEFVGKLDGLGQGVGVPVAVGVRLLQCLHQGLEVFPLGLPLRGGARQQVAVDELTNALQHAAGVKGAHIQLAIVHLHPPDVLVLAAPKAGPQPGQAAVGEHPGGVAHHKLHVLVPVHAVQVHRLLQIGVDESAVQSAAKLTVGVLAGLGEKDALQRDLLIVVLTNIEVVVVHDQVRRTGAGALRVDDEGLGFDYKWNMGWMNDFTEYMKYDPVYRGAHHDQLTFSMVYAYSEKFMLSLSHDEVVHLKGSMYTKMPGTPEQKMANLRLAYAYQMVHPGKKLLFMGQEFGQEKEWNEKQSLSWELLEDKEHLQLKNYMAALHTFYKANPALYQLDEKPEGFEWINGMEWEKNLLIFLRRTKKKEDTLLVVCNFSNVEYDDFRIGVPYPGKYKEMFNSDAEAYGGTGVGNPRVKMSKKTECDERKNSITVKLAPLSVQVFSYTKPETGAASNKRAKAKTAAKAATEKKTGKNVKSAGKPEEAVKVKKTTKTAGKTEKKVSEKTAKRAGKKQGTTIATEKVEKAVKQAIDSKPVKTVEQTVDKLVKAGKFAAAEAAKAVEKYRAADPEKKPAANPETKSEAKSGAKPETKTKKSTGMSELGEELQRKFETEER